MISSPGSSPIKCAAIDSALHNRFPWTVLLVLGGHKDDEELLRMIQQVPQPAVNAAGDNRQSRELRTYGIGAQIIADLGVRKMRVRSAPWKLTGLAGFGLEVVEYLESLGGRKET